MNYPEALAWLYGTQLHGINPGLERIRRLLDALGVVFPTGTCIFHVAGTNGKGSVCAMLEAICRAAGYRTGLFISPHLISCRERAQIDREPISEEDFAALMTRIREQVSSWEQCPTFFELVTALALAHFQKQGVKVLVLETGMGGRLDATNIVDSTISVITAIGYDHQQWLGDTLETIATEKAGIIKAGRPVVTQSQDPEAQRVLHEVAHQRQAPLHLVSAPTGQFPVGLVGSHQRWNAALAIQAIQHSGLTVNPAAIARGLATVDWPGRFQQVHPKLILDGAHNAPAARCLVEAWREIRGTSKATVLMAVLKDKAVEDVCAALGPIAARFITVGVQNPRSCTAEDLAAVLRRLHPTIPTTPGTDLPAAYALAQAHPEPVLVTGSLFLVGEVLARLANGQPPPETSLQ